MQTSKAMSTCTLETAQSTHVFDIFGYSQHRGIGVGKYISSGDFSVGGHDWSIVLFPDGIKKDPNCIIITLHLHWKGAAAKARASYDLRLVDQTTRLPSSVHKQTMEFDTANGPRAATAMYRNRSEFEKSIYLRDGRLTIECTVTVFKEPHVSETKSFPEIEVPPSDLTEHLCKLLHEKEGMDVTFSVGGDTFDAHKIVLAMRSPVFKAEFYGLMSEGVCDLSLSSTWFACYGGHTSTPTVYYSSPRRSQILGYFAVFSGHPLEMQTSKTVSTCTPEMAQGTHVFDIFGYSQHRGIGVGKYISSGDFSVGGHDWSIVLFPDGIKKDPNCIIIALHLHWKGAAAKARASYDLRLVDQTTRLPSSVHKQTMEFDTANGPRAATAMYINRSEFEKSIYLRDGRLTIECTVTVFKEPHVSETKSFPEIEVPPSDLTEHLCKLLHEKEGMDVTFSVGGDTFDAHKIVLATRSPVFKAEFYGLMSEASAQFVTVKDMQPAVFKALLHFIYTDSLPAMDDREGDDYSEMIGHLLVPADRYAMHRLKLVCQSILCKNLNVETVATTSAIADQHNCDRLKDACLQFISCSNALDDVVATQGYKNLKRDCPSVVVDVLEKEKKFRKT